MKVIKALPLLLASLSVNLLLRGGTTEDNNPALADRAKYEMTVSRLKILLQACSQYNIDSNRYPPASSIDELKKALVHDYLPPEAEWRDGWDRPFHVLSWDEPQPAPPPAVVAITCMQNIQETEMGQDTECIPEPVTTPSAPPEPIHHWHLMLASAGADGIWERSNLREYRGGWNTNPQEDLVVLDGEWLRRMKPYAENWRSALAETRQKLFALATALQAYITDKNKSPDAASLDHLIAELVPDYLPLGFAARQDAWGNPLRFQRWQDPPSPDGNPGKIHYRIASASRDGRFETGDLRSYSPRESIDANDDLVLDDGRFLCDYLDPQVEDATRIWRTKIKLKTLASALEQYAINHAEQYPPGADVQRLLALLPADSMPGTIPELLRFDNWHRPVRYYGWQVELPGEGSKSHYCVASAGVDGQWEFGNLRFYYSVPRSCGNGVTDDIALCDGQYTRDPTLPANCPVAPK